MALQYISECMAMAAAACSSDNTVACQPPEAHITEVYAANCGVELPTVDVISGRRRERAGPEGLAGRQHHQCHCHRDPRQGAHPGGRRLRPGAPPRALLLVPPLQQRQRQLHLPAGGRGEGHPADPRLLQRSRSDLVQRRGAARRRGGCTPPPSLFLLSSW
ncbi:hypothetical protein PVAP13_1KG558001 [Panicum virgatum]|uniref:Uncharacterized protein n=1 Tax=Panicum virgatum TaxID=38727 RepID=A0A8T0XMY4_PANVG|nr:hypothetical protein PVAP13_1KG558001 [Panicum virgatum]KAG2662812.1 hypothetical protein PVAP13_1KG558001 [Panicum virgatum]